LWSIHREFLENHRATIKGEKGFGMKTEGIRCINAMGARKQAGCHDSQLLAEIA
jgi:hypothetical protein